MTLEIKHTFQSAKGDGADATLVQPSNWNDTHTITMAADKVIGRSGSSGAAQELTFTTLAQTLAACTTAADFIAALGLGAFSTGDVKFTIKTTADAGWIMMDDGTIGDGSSAASSRANDDCEALFTLLWEGISDTYAPVTGGRGVSAAADWAAHKKISLTKVLGRALAAAGSGSGLSARTLGQTTGAETHTLSEAEIPAHDHTITDPGHTHTTTPANPIVLESVAGGSQFTASTAKSVGMSINSATTGITIDNAGGGGSHNNVQPTTFLNCMIKV